MSKTKIFLDTEFTERERLLELQRSKTRWFSQEEFDRLKELSNKCLPMRVRHIAHNGRVLPKVCHSTTNVY